MRNDLLNEVINHLRNNKLGTAKRTSAANVVENIISAVEKMRDELITAVDGEENIVRRHNHLRIAA